MRDVHPGSGSWFVTHLGSRIQRSKSTGSWIPDPDPQHWIGSTGTSQFHFLGNGVANFCINIFGKRQFYGKK
jgi:hypothetical protein